MTRSILIVLLLVAYAKQRIYTQEKKNKMQSIIYNTKTSGTSDTPDTGRKQRGKNCEHTQKYSKGEQHIYRPPPINRG